MITLYGVYRSRATRPLWVLHECGAPFTHIPVVQAYRLADPLDKDAPLNTRTPDFLAINPSGQVPALRDGPLVLTESMAMALYIARKHGGPLGPQGEAELALSENWALFAMTGVEPHTISILYTYGEKLADTPDGQAKIAAGVEALTRPLARLEAHLAGEDYLMGGRFTVADIMVAEVLRYGQAHAPLFAPFPKVAAWLARCQGRAAFKEMMAKRLAEPE